MAKTKARRADVKGTLIEALKLVCDTLARERDSEPLPRGWIEDLKYQVVDRALEAAIPGFDGGTTSLAEAAEAFADYRAALKRADGTATADDVRAMLRAIARAHADADREGMDGGRLTSPEPVSYLVDKSSIREDLADRGVRLSEAEEARARSIVAAEYRAAMEGGR